MTTLTTPDWLAQRDGTLREGLSPTTRLVLLSGHPQYRLSVVPARGKFACSIVQSVNGGRLDEGKEYPSSHEALQGGLETLRAKLGW